MIDLLLQHKVLLMKYFHHNTKSHVIKEIMAVKVVTYRLHGLSYNKLVYQLMLVYHTLLEQVKLRHAQRHVLMDQKSNYIEPKVLNHTEELLMLN